MRENGEKPVRLFIVTKDPDDAVLAQVRLNVAQLLRFVDDHQRPGHADAP